MSRSKIPIIPWSNNIWFNIRVFQTDMIFLFKFGAFHIYQSIGFIFDGPDTIFPRRIFCKALNHKVNFKRNTVLFTRINSKCLWHCAKWFNAGLCQAIHSYKILMNVVEGLKRFFWHFWSSNLVKHSNNNIENFKKSLKSSLKSYFWQILTKIGWKIEFSRNFTYRLACIIDQLWLQRCQKMRFECKYYIL